MLRKTKIVAGKIAAISLVVPALIVANSFGPLPRNTGAPGDRTCARATTCHIGTPDSGTGRIEYVGLATYVPGVWQSFEFEVVDPAAKVFGFQVSARPVSDPQFGQAGRLENAQANTIVLCEDGVQRLGDASCAPTAPVEFLEHEMAQDNGRFRFDWVPPATDIGDVKIYIAALAADDSRTPQNDQMYTAELTLSTLSFDGAPVIRESQAVLQAFDNSERLSPNTHIQIFGERLAATGRGWSPADFDPGIAPGAIAPTMLDGVEVLVNGKNAYISFVSPEQVNAVVPDDIGEGPMNVVVRHAGGESSTTVTATAVSPTLQEHPLWVGDGKEYVVALPRDGGGFIGPAGLVPNVTMRPATPGEVMTFYALGCGPAEPAVATGTIPGRTDSGDVYRLPEGSFEIRFGETVASAVGFLAPDWVGLYRFDATVPNLGDGDYQITLVVDGVETGQSLFTSVAQK